MKKIIDLILLVMMLLSFCTITADAADEISSFGVSVSGFGIGAKKSDVNFALFDDRLEIAHKVFIGKFGEDDTFLEQKSYMVKVGVRIKSDVNARFPGELPVENIRFSGIDASVKVSVLENRKVLLLSFTIETPKPAETIAKEETAEAAKHKHCFCGGDVIAGAHTKHSEVTFKEWNGKSKITYDKDGVAYVCLTDNVQRDTALNVGGGKTLTICLNGHYIQMVGQDRVMSVGVGGKLRICDCTRSADSKISGGHAEYGAGIHNNGTLIMYGGVITKNNGGYGGGVYNNTNFYLYGGDIYDNRALYGGGVWNDNDSTTTFTMYNGTITLNTASCGGAVYNNDGASLALKGGNIVLNVAGTAGGAVWNNGGTVELDGGMILENTSKHGGGMWNNGGTVFIRSGNISKNMATSDPSVPDGYGGGIWNNGGLVIMTGGEITFNKAKSGGGVWVNGGSEFVMSGGVIAENEANEGAGIYIQKYDEKDPAGTFRMSGNAGIVLNYAFGPGSGAYVKGILNIDGEAEVIGNVSEGSENIDIYVADSGVVNRNLAMPTQFIDVNFGDYFSEPVKWALENNITSGTTDVTFSPDDKCTRGQVVTFLYRMHGSPETDGFYFADTSPSDYFYDATRWAWELKMERSNAFSPNAYCARYSAIKYMWIAAGSPKVERTLPFTDVPADADYAMAVAWALETGITDGTTPETFSPNDYCTRAQIITFLYRAFNK